MFARRSEAEFYFLVANGCAALAGLLGRIWPARVPGQVG